MAETIVQACRFCGNVTVLTLAASGSHPRLEESVEGVKSHWTTWRVWECSTCAQPMLERDDVLVDGQPGPAPPRTKHPEIVFPVVREARWEPVPVRVRSMYEEAIKVEKISPRACAVMAGLALEAICEYEEAKGGTLAQRLQSLTQCGRLPRTLAEMAGHVRHVRNVSAHLMDETIREDDVPTLLYFVEAILEYLYVAPAKIEVVRRKVFQESTRVDDEE